MPSTKQIGTICFALSFIISPKFTFADNEPTVIPTPANCNEAVLNTTEGSADLEAIYTANTINTTWYSGYGNNASVANATQCSYDGTINLPQTNPTRAGYAFNGWKLRAPANPLLNLDTSIAATDNAFIELNGESDYNNTSPESYGLTENGTAAVTYSYGDIYMEASCNTTSVSGGDLFAVGADLDSQNLSEEEYNAQTAQIMSTFNYVTRPGNTFTRGANGDICWCHVYGYKPTNGTIQSTQSAPWVLLGNISLLPETSCVGDNCTTTYQNCNEECAVMCMFWATYGSPDRFLPVLYGQ